MRNLDSKRFGQFSGGGWAALLLRIVVGYGFVQHGLAKILKGPDAFAGILQAIGVPAAHLMAWLTIGTELVGGIAVLLGAFIPLVSVPLAMVLLVAIFTVHLPYGFSSIKLLAVTSTGARFGPVGYETNLLYLAALACLSSNGSGPLGLNGWLKMRRERPAAYPGALPEAKELLSPMLPPSSRLR